jgi:hypothetical protein
MAVQLCCPGGAALVLMLAIASRDATSDSCRVHSGPRAYATGVLANGSCAYCTTAGTVQPCSSGMQSGTVAYPGRTNRSGCVGRWCLSCGGPIHPPPGSSVYLSPQCGFFDDSVGDRPALADLRGPLVNVSLIVAAAGIRLNQTLTLAGTSSVVGGPLHISSPPPGCGVQLTNTPGHTTIKATIGSGLRVTGPECGVSVAPAHFGVGIIATVSVGSIRPGPFQNGPFFSVAAANVAGAISTTAPDNTAVLLDRSYTHRVAFPSNPQNWSHVVNLSAYLAVFGASYEIAYYHDGQRTIPTPAWVDRLAAANKVLAPIAAIVAIGILRSAAVAPKVHVD